MEIMKYGFCVVGRQHCNDKRKPTLKVLEDVRSADKIKPVVEKTAVL